MTPPVQPTPLDKVLALRPTNTVQRFGPQSRLPVLNPRDLLAALEATGAALVCVPIFSRSAIGGVLRASRDEDAVVGLGCPYPLGDRVTPLHFAETVRDVAEEVRHRKPLFLQAGPFRLHGNDPRERERLAAAAFKYVDAGFTLMSVDASALAPDEAAGAYREILFPAIERELSVEIAAPLDDEGRLATDALRATLEALRKRRVTVNFVRVAGRAYALEPNPRETWQLDLSVLKEAAAVARDFGAALSIEEDGVTPDQLASAWREAGVRKADPYEAAARIVLNAWPAERVETLRTDAADQRVHPRDLIASLDASEDDPKAKLKIEALHWSLAVDLLASVQARGSASRAIAILSQGGRY